MATKRNARPNSHGGWYKLPPFVRDIQCRQYEKKDMP
jgi:hypothetical protein